MIYIIVKAEPDSDSRSFTYSFEDLGVTEQEWDSLNDDAKDELLQDTLNKESEQPYWVVSRYQTSQP